MRFKLRRTSKWYDEDIEVDGAYKAKTMRDHVRTCTEEEFNKRFSDKEGLWRDNGTNHRILDECNYICRDEEDECYFIDIENLDELVVFAEKYCSVIVTRDDSHNMELEIYDDYRE